MFKITCLLCGVEQTIKQESIQNENWQNDIQLDCYLGGRGVLIICTECKNEISLDI